MAAELDRILAFIDREIVSAEPPKTYQEAGKLALKIYAKGYESGFDASSLDLRAGGNLIDFIAKTFEL